MLKTIPWPGAYAEDSWFGVGRRGEEVEGGRGGGVGGSCADQQGEKKTDEKNEYILYYTTYTHTHTHAQKTFLKQIFILFMTQSLKNKGKHFP